MGGNCSPDGAALPYRQAAGTRHTRSSRAMDAPHEQQRTLPTPGGDLPLHEYHLRAGGRAWAILHTGAVLSRDDESQVIGESRDRLPYGVVLWPSALALAHELLARADALHGKRILELGAGTGLPGIVAATLGARVVQTDRNELVLSVCRTQRRAQWCPGDRVSPGRLGRVGRQRALRPDHRRGHPLRRGDARRVARHLRAQPRARREILLTDPFRAASLPLLEALDTDGWNVAITKWNIGEDAAMRPVGLFELTPPANQGQ